MYALILAVTGSFLFFHKLGASSLTNWDEAWYAEIAKQIGVTGNLLIMRFGGAVFTDHPPAGFWIMSIFQSVFGVNEFGSRAGSAVFGLICVLTVYLLGKKLFSATAGFAAALALLSAPWFVLRARSGNLDIFLTTLFVLSVYLAFLARENKKFLPHLAVSLAFLFLTKTMVPLTIIPALIIIFWGNRKIKIKDLAKPAVFFFVLTVPWVIANFSEKPDFIQRYLKIGLPGVEAKTDYLENAKLVKEYLHNGIGKWFWPGVLGGVYALFSRERRFTALLVMALTLVAPFVFSEKGHIWHMIPIYPFLLLLLFGAGDAIAKKILKYKILVNLSLLVFALLLFIPGTRANWHNFINIDAYISDEAILARAAKDYTEPLFIDGDFVPVATFYSNKVSVAKVNVPLQEFFENNKNFLLITHEARLLSEIGEEGYELVAKDRDKVLLLVN